MELSAARSLMAETKTVYLQRKQDVAIAKLTNPKTCLHAGPFLRFSDACRLFVAAKLKQLYRERKTRRNSDDAVILRTELANCRSFYQTLLKKRRSAEPIRPVQPVQPQPVQQKRQSIERNRRCRAAARGRRDVFVKKVAEHQRRFLLRHQQSE